MARGAARPPPTNPRLPTDAASHPSLWAKPPGRNEETERVEVTAYRHAGA
jgi:hypothetical protein